MSNPLKTPNKSSSAHNSSPAQKSSPANQSSPANRSNTGSNNGTPTSSSSRHRIGNVDDYSLFPRDNRDFAAAFMNQGDNDELNRTPAPANPPPWEDPAESWRYVGDRVYTGEGFVYAPRPEIPSNPMPAPGSPQGLAAAAPQVPQAHAAYGNPPQGPPVSAYAQPPQGPVAAASSSTSAPAPATGPRHVSAWTDEMILRLYKWKMIKKKGYPSIVKDFPGETETSLNAAWKAHRPAGERLFKEEEEE